MIKKIGPIAEDRTDLFDSHIIGPIAGDRTDLTPDEIVPASDFVKFVQFVAASNGVA